MRCARTAPVPSTASPSSRAPSGSSTRPVDREATMERYVAFAAFILAAVCLILIPTEAAAIVRYVAVNGVDSPTCGTVAAPCRSISRALVIASAGDTIEVGPGRYGDLDRDGQAATDGDEKGEPGCGCAISSSKRVIIRSSAGAPATIIEPNQQDAVHIGAEDAVFGQLGRGFTLRAVSGVRISG